MLDRQTLSDDRLSAGWCEYCGRPGYTEKHHIKTRGAGGKDVQENFVRLCPECHDLAQQYRIDRLELIQIVAARESLTPQDVCLRIGLPVPDEFPSARDIKEPPTLEELIQAYINLDEQRDECNFLKGQLLVALTDAGVKKGWIASQVRSSVSQIKVLIRTYKAFPREDMRVPELTWYHHRLAAHTDKPQEWITKAVENEWSTREMSQAIKEESSSEGEADKAMQAARTVFKKAERILAAGGLPAEWLKKNLQKMICG